MRTARKILFAILVILALAIGLYPLLYLTLDPQFGLLSTKSDALLATKVWKLGFYTHISLGGLALLIGWTQFISRLRIGYPEWHRRTGYVYLTSVVLSGFAAFAIGPVATGGVIASSGFMSLAVVWMATTMLAYRAILRRDLVAHQKWMIYSYAACFAAVTLRIWLPLLASAFGDFVTAYRIVAWLCWVPNIAIAAIIVKNISRQRLA